MWWHLDTVVERTVLMEEVYPRLREFCQLKGRELEVCDLHWGLRDSVSDDHRVPEIICKTLARCQECNVGVNLLVRNKRVLFINRGFLKSPRTEVSY